LILSEKSMAIIGNGGAAIQSIKALRHSNYQGKIYLFSDHERPAYNPMLTSYYVAGKIPYENCFPYGNNFQIYEDYQVDLHLGSPVVELDTKKQKIVTGEGKKYYYDGCIIATGASAVLPSSMQSQQVKTLRTMDDAIALKNCLERGVIHRALVVGASMVGIKVVELLLAQGVRVSLADLAPQVFPLAAHPHCARLVEEYLQKKGVRLRLGTRIERIEDRGNQAEVLFAGGDEGELVDLVVMCIGVRPNLQFLDPDQIQIDQGIVVDEKMRSSVPNIFAAGDVAQGKNLLNGKKEIIGLWHNALYQGRTAGHNLAGKDDTYPGSIPQNITNFLGMVFTGIGEVRCGVTRETFINLGEGYGRLFWHSDRLIGANLLTTVPYVGMLRQFLVKNITKNDRLTLENGFSEDYWTSIINQLFPMYS
jgi:NAD(P)H-nitrite reductase large subunit